MRIANAIGSNLLPFTNPRVVCPPGTPAHNGRRNIVVATPMRSGTHVFIDLVLNNLAAYRTRPLYIDLDQCLKQSNDTHDLVGAVRPDAGHLVKTHLPIDLDETAVDDPRMLRVFDHAVVVTVRRDRDAVMRSLSQWSRSAVDLERHGTDFDAFWSFWEGRATFAVDFDSLFDPTEVAPVLADLASLTSTSLRSRLVMPPSADRRSSIYVNKGLTRLVGRRAPRIDTTIHTLKG